MTNRQTAIKIVRRLRRNGYQALLAGGCVRDMLLGRAANDYDVATDAAPAEVTKLFRRTLKVGAKFGVVIVLLEGRQVEVATFRTETGYTDGRHPTTVKFADAREDASRRDFTINGMFYDPVEQKVIDYVNGFRALPLKTQNLESKYWLNCEKRSISHLRWPPFSPAAAPNLRSKNVKR